MLRYVTSRHVTSRNIEFIWAHDNRTPIGTPYLSWGNLNTDQETWSVRFPHDKKKCSHFVVETLSFCRVRKLPYMSSELWVGGGSSPCWHLLTGGAGGIWKFWHEFSTTTSGIFFYSKVLHHDFLLLNTYNIEMFSSEENVNQHDWTRFSGC